MNTLQNSNCRDFNSKVLMRRMKGIYLRDSSKHPKIHDMLSHKEEEETLSSLKFKKCKDIIKKADPK